MLDSVRKLIMGNPLTAVGVTAVVSGGLGYYLGSPSETSSNTPSSEKKKKDKKKDKKKESEN